MKRALVTIGLCIKNSESTIKEAISSIFDQDFSHELMELIVVDGYSTDKTMRIMKESLINANIENRIFFDDKGLGAARNIVVNNAHGNYVIWVDGDMILSEDFVRKQVEFMEKHPRVAIAGGKFKGLLSDNLIAFLENVEWMVLDSEFENGKMMLVPFRHFCGGSIYRTKAIRQIGGFDDKIKGASEDLDAEYRICKAGWYLYFVTNAIFHDRRKKTLKGIWKENFWYGYGMHYFLHKNKHPIPATRLCSGITRIISAYKLTGRKLVFLLPIQYLFKKIAWFFGFIKGHIDGYGHFRAS